MSDLLQKLEAIHFRFIEVGNLITDPDIIADMKRYVKLNKEYRDLEVLDQTYKTYSNLLSNLKSARELRCSIGSGINTDIVNKIYNRLGYETVGFKFKKEIK